MVQLKKTSATLDELVAREDEVKTEIRSLQKQLKSIRVTRKSIQKLTEQLPTPKPARRKKSKTVAAAA